MPRVKGLKAKSVKIDIRVHPDEKKALQAEAARRGYTLSSWILQTLLREAKLPRFDKAS